MNESNFARSDAKADARFAQFEVRFAQFDAKADARFAQFEVRFVQFEAKADTRFAQFEARVDARLSGFVAQLERGFKEQSRFILLGHATLLAAIIAGIVLK